MFGRAKLQYLPVASKFSRNKDGGNITRADDMFCFGMTPFAFLKERKLDEKRPCHACVQYLQAGTERSLRGTQEMLCLRRELHYLLRERRPGRGKAVANNTSAVTFEIGLSLFCIIDRL